MRSAAAPWPARWTMALPPSPSASVLGGSPLPPAPGDPGFPGSFSVPPYLHSSEVSMH